jgi:hypothetical protein
MSKVDVAIKTLEQMHEREANTRLSQRMQASTKDVGAVDTFRHNILSHVATEAYTTAIDEIKEYADSKGEYPAFKDRAGRYASYAIDLVNAIKAKRSFPGLQHLSMSKQQELFDRAMEHFEDLKHTLRKIEQVDREVRLEDVRSTVWVVKAVVYSVTVLLTVGFLLETSKGVIPAIDVLLDQSFGDVTNWVFDKIGM